MSSINAPEKPWFAGLPPEEVIRAIFVIGGPDAEEYKRQIEDYCDAREFVALIDYDEVLGGYVFHTLINLNNTHNVIKRIRVAKRLGHRESSLRRRIAARLRLQGDSPREEVKVPGGRVDIVTSEAVYEVKCFLDATTIRAATKQVLKYRELLPGLRAIVIGHRAPHTSAIGRAVEEAARQGVEVVFFEEARP